MTAPERLVIHDIPVEVRLNKRRKTRMGMTIDPGGYLVLDVPLNLSMSEVEAVVIEHQRWLKHRLSQVRKTTGASSHLSYQAGELIHLRGDALTLVVEPSLFESIVRVESKLLVSAPQTDPMQVRRIVTQWYAEQAQALFAEVLQSYAQLPWLHGKQPPWGHRYMRSQWGSCSARGRLSLNTHLVKTPLALVEYVVLHELCHLKHHNHGKRFHGLVEKYMPDWQNRSNELQKFMPILLQV